MSDERDELVGFGVEECAPQELFHRTAHEARADPLDAGGKAPRFNVSGPDGRERSSMATLPSQTCGSLLRKEVDEL
jgi:hypothetical protein